jgi:hypothetical protein
MAAVSFLALTDVDQIRSAIGVDTTDLSDEVILDRKPEEDLEADLLTWVPTYQTVITEGVAASPTTEQRLKYLKLKLYSKYFLSALIASSGSLSILQKQSDGANEAIRFTNVKISELVSYLRAEADKYQEELRELIDPSATSGYSQFGVASPNYDPVVNS